MTSIKNELPPVATRGGRGVATRLGRDPRREAFKDAFTEVGSSLVRRLDGLASTPAYSGEDVLQAAAEHTWRSLGRDRRLDPRAGLFDKVAHDRAYDMHRAEERRRLTKTVQFDEGTLGRSRPLGRALDDIVGGREEARIQLAALRAELDELKERDAPRFEAVAALLSEAVHPEGVTAAQVGVRVGMSEGNVRVSYCRFLARARARALAEYEDQEVAA